MYRQSSNTSSLGLDEFKTFSDVFEDDIRVAVTVEASVQARSSLGGTNPDRVKDALEAARGRLADYQRSE